MDVLSGLGGTDTASYGSRTTAVTVTINKTQRVLHIGPNRRTVVSTCQLRFAIIPRANMFRDLRHGVRMLLQAKGWTAIVVISLALGIGANTALFSAINGLLLKTEASQTFLDPVFLLLATLLGGCCTFVYLRTGSIWPSTLIHWLSLVSWKAFLGGRIF